MADKEPWKQLYQYWLSRHVDGHPPGRPDIDPLVDVPRLVANIMLIAIIGERLRYRLVGSAIWNRYQSELTGTWIERRNPAEADWHDTLGLVRDDLVPRLVSTPVPGHDDRSHVAIAMPLVGPDGKTGQILAGTFFAQEYGENLRVGRLSVQEVLEVHQAVDTPVQHSKP